jgi:hypothetical protein
MARIEKTVFLSYRRKDLYEALAVYQHLTNQQYDVFLDYKSISSGDFEQHKVVTINPWFFPIKSLLISQKGR